MTHHYRTYGLTLQAPRPIPGLMPVFNPDNVDLHIDFLGPDGCRLDHLPKKLWYASRKDVYGNYAHVWKLAGGRYYQFSYSDGATFVINKSGDRLRISWPSSLSLEDIATYLSGHILGFTLGLKGCFCLHASAVNIDGKAVALMAPGGGGKSTTAAVFAALGYSVVTDDVLVLHPRGREFMVQPGYPRLNLWPVSTSAIPDIDSELPCIVPDSPTYNKRYLDLFAFNNRFQRKSLMLAAIYTGEPTGDTPTPYVDKLSARDAVISLVPNLYRFPLIDRSGLKKEFENLGRIASSVPVRSVKFIRDLRKVTQLCRVILDDFRSINSVTEQLN